MECWTQHLGNAVEISLMSHLQAEIQRLLSLYFGELYNFRFFAAAILAFWMMMDMLGWCHLIAQTYLGKVTKGYLFTPCGPRLSSEG